MAKAATRAQNHATMDRIVDLAAVMLARNGYNGPSFLSLGKQLGIGHSNIHYYFKTKDDLVEYLLQLYTDQALAFFKVLWEDREIDLRNKLTRTRDWLRESFNRFSSGEGGGRIGFIGAMASDAAHLSPKARRILKDINVGLDDHIRTGIDIAVQNGDLAPDAPREEIALQILWLLYSSRIIVRHGNRFENLDRLFQWTMEVIERAYGQPARSAANRPARTRAPQG